MTRPGDALEREADVIAERALRGAAQLAPASTAPAGTVLRQATSADEKRHQPIYEEDEDFDVAASSRTHGAATAPSGFLAGLDATGGGSPLAPPVRERMEHGFGRSFEHVRIHSDAGAARLSSAIGARAFTHGQNVFFDHRENSPGTPEGDRLLAHELAHTLQRPDAQTVARQRKPKARPQFDPKRMTDEEKIALRTRIHDTAVERVRELREKFAKDPSVSAAKVSARKARLDAAIAGAQKIKEPRQLKARVEYLRGERRLMNDPFYAWALITGEFHYGSGDDTVIRALGDPGQKFAEGNLEAGTSAMASGPDAFFVWTGESQIYGGLGIDPKALQTAEQSSAEQAGGAGQGTGPAGTPPSTGGSDPAEVTLEQRKLIEEANTALAEQMTDDGIAAVDPVEVARELAKLSADERKDLYEFARRMLETSKPGSAQKSLLDLIQDFNKLDPASREALAVNRELGEQEPGQPEALPKQVLLNLQQDVKEQRTAADDAKTIKKNLDLIRATVKDPEAKKDLTDLAFEESAFFHEMAMLLGLLAGGGSRSPLVLEVGKQLVHEIVEFQEKVRRELLELAAESAALALITAASEGLLAPLTVARLATLAKRIREVKRLIETLQRIYAIYQRVERVIQIVQGAGESYAKFRRWFEGATQVYSKLEAELGKLDSSEDIEEMLEAQEEKLLEELDKQLEGKLGELLEMLYIPEDTTPEELRRILFDIPRGISSLGDMWDYYREGDQSSEHFADVLSTKAFKAGAQLYPLVGLTAALVAEELQKAFPQRTIGDRIDRLISKASRGPGLKQRNRGLFGRLQRKHYDYKVADLMPYLQTARDSLRKALDDDEEGSGTSEHWAPVWFKDSVRREIKEVNKQFKGKTIPAERKAKGPDGRTTKVKENVPLPPFRVRVKRPLLNRKRLEVDIKLNPKLTLEVDRLSNDDFAGNGIKFGGTPARRQDAIRRWLRDAGYELIKAPDGQEHIRLPGAEAGSRNRSYLHFEGDRIKQGIDKGAWKAFRGRLVHDSRDLPEGYYAVHLKGEDTVSRKSGLQRPDHQQLGLDQAHKLIEGAGSAPPKVIAKPGVTKPTAFESFDYRAPLDEMFGPKKPGGAEYHLQYKTRASWTSLIDREPELQKRPRTVKGRFGYIVRARAFGDLLGSRHIPELQKRDDKGHLVAKRFGGVDDYGNLTPMLRSQNQYPGRWYGLESDMADVYVGKKAAPAHYVDFELSLIYPHGKTRRPSKFAARYQEKDANDKNVGSPRRQTVDNE